MMNYKKKGDKGENAAAAFLEKKGYKIIEKNYRARRWAEQGNRRITGEIDLIAEDKLTLVFVEVKTAYSKNFGSPESWVNEKKQKQVTRTAMQYLYDHSIQDQDCRFDVISILNDTIQHFENAFQPRPEWIY